MRNAVRLSAALCGMCAAVCAENVTPIAQMDVSQVSCGWRSPQTNLSIDGNALKIGGRVFSAGLGVHAPSRGSFDLEKNCARFEATVGVDDESFGSVEFKVWGDGKLLWESGRMTARSQPRAKDVKVDVTGVETLVLEVTDAGDNRDGDHADWADARFIYPDGQFAANDPRQSRQLGILTPPVRPEPRINGPAVYGVRPGHPVICHLPITGEEPLAVQVLVEDGRQMQDYGPLSGLRFDPVTRTIGGRVDEPGIYPLTVQASNARGTATKRLTLKVGKGICLTPVMAWSSLDAPDRLSGHYGIISAANALFAARFADHGWNTIIVDGQWARTNGPLRTAEGTVLPNANFPNMKKLTAYLHGRGFKVGISSSPGPVAADGCVGSWMHEFQDAHTFADWGFDMLKYDWLGYEAVAVGQGLQRAMFPCLLMGTALRDQNRDIVLAISTRGDITVSSWGAYAHAHSWSTSCGLSCQWLSVANAISRQRQLWHFSAPGAFNDPGILCVGPMRRNNFKGSGLLPNEQYTQMSLWALMAAPLVISCDPEQLDDFTCALLTNDEVIEIDQDALGKAAACVASEKKWEVWARPLADGSIAAGFYNKGARETDVSLDMAALGLEGEWRVRDCWRQKDEGVFSGTYRQAVPGHATHLVRLFPQKGACCRLLDVRTRDYQRVGSF